VIKDMQERLYEINGIQKIAKLFCRTKK